MPSAVKLKPTSVGPHLNLGAVLKDLGKLQEAEICTRKAIKLNPNLAIAHSNLVQSLKILEDWKKHKFITKSHKNKSKFT